MYNTKGNKSEAICLVTINIENKEEKLNGTICKGFGLLNYIQICFAFYGV